MATVTLRGNPIEVAGRFPKVGQPVPSVTLVGKDLKGVSLGEFAGVAARTVFVLDERDRVLHAELAPEIKNEPDYEAALKALR
jgi:peroxiredoxin